jgi:hypothetical protein
VCVCFVRVQQVNQLTVRMTSHLSSPLNALTMSTHVMFSGSRRDELAFIAAATAARPCNHSDMLSETARFHKLQRTYVRVGACVVICVHKLSRSDYLLAHTHTRKTTPAYTRQYHHECFCCIVSPVGKRVCVQPLDTNTAPCASTTTTHHNNPKKVRLPFFVSHI